MSLLLSCYDEIYVYISRIMHDILYCMSRTNIQVETSK